MSPFAVSGLLAGFSSLFFGLVVYLKSPNRRLARIWFLFSISAAVWGFGSFWIGTEKNSSEALLIWQLSYVFGVIWIPILFYHFVCIFCEIKRPPFLLTQYFIGILFLFITPTSLHFSEVRWLFDSFYYASSGLLFPFFFLWWTGLVFYSHYLLLRTYKKFDSNKKNQIRYFFIATAIGYGGGCLCYLPIFGFELYPWGNFTIFLYPYIMTYAILKFRLMDVRVLIRRAVLLTSVYVGLLLLITPLVFWIQKEILSSPNHSFFLLFFGIFLTSLIISFGPFLYAYFARRSAYFKEYTLAGITHELKSPLGAIQSAADIIQRDLPPSTEKNDRLRTYVEMIQKNCERLEAFIKDLLHVAKIQTNDFSLNRQKIKMEDLVHGAIDKYEEKARKKGIKIQFNLLPTQEIALDPEKISQVLSNLISNSIKFSEEGSITVHLKNSGADLQTIITDKGRGIPPHQLDLIFDRFFQANPNGKGTGVGLTIAKAWVEAHGGKIWAESEGEGKGSRFTFTLPQF